jgi:anti-sigma factor RsiW
MPQNAYRDDLPLDLQLDLLVDGELPEQRRRALLAALDGQPDQWRAVALRFLQHQTEEQTVHALMAGGNLVPAELTPGRRERPSVIGRMGWRRLTAVAAGLVIAASSALVTLVVVRSSGPSAGVDMAREFHTALPADFVALDRPVPVSVPVVPAGRNQDVFQVRTAGSQPGRTMMLVQPDGKDSFMVIPVSMSRAAVY